MKKILLVASCIALAGCQTTGYTPASETLPTLKIAFFDSAWDGKTVPKSQICSIDGGKGSTPAMTVSGVPAGANAILVEFNDQGYAPLSSGGGHGIIGYWLDSTGTVTLNSVPGETSDVGTKSFVEARSRSTGRYASSGYLPPCSGGRGHLYFADVKAVYKATKEGEESKLLAQGRIDLGTH